MTVAMDEQVRKEIKDKYGKDASFAMAAGLVPGLVSMGGPNKSERRASIAGKQPRRSFDNGNYSAGGHSKSQRRSFDGKDPNSTKKSTFQRDANDIGMDSAHPLPHSVRTALAQSHKENMSGRNTIAVGRRGSTKSQRRSFDGKIGP